MSRSSADPPSGDWYRDAQGPLRAFFRDHEDHPQYQRLQQSLDRAAMQLPADAYLATATRRAAVGAAVGALLGLGVIWVLALVNVIPGGLAVGLGALGAFGGAFVGFAGVFGGQYVYPRLVAHRRARHTEAMLPHSTLFLYALVHGGTPLYTVLEDLADAEEIYGEAAVEFDRLVTELEWLGVDLLTGIDRAADRAPSDELAGFFEELGNVLETGGDTQSFLGEMADTQLDRAEDELEQFLDDIEIISEIYIVLVFAGPIFLFVTLVIISFFNPLGLTFLKLLVYLYIPLGILVYLWLYGHLIGPLQFSLGHVTFDTTDRETAHATPQDISPGEKSGWLTRLRRQGQRLRTYSLRETLRGLHTRPGAVFVVSLPLALLALGGIVLTGVFPVGVDALFTKPVRGGVGMVVIPFAITTIPPAVVYEWNERRVTRIRERFPTALRIVADANRNGVPLGECFDIVAERTSAPLGDELARVYRDIQWFHDIDRALKTFANRLAVPTVSRVVYLLTASLESTHDIGKIADTVARDLETRNELIDRRHERMQSYVVVVFIGVLVFLVIVALFELSFLPVLKRLSKTEGEAIRRTPLDLGDVSIVTYRRLLFHAALIQAAGNGLLLGKMADNNIYSGFKYANVLLLLVVGIFWVLL